MLTQRARLRQMLLQLKRWLPNRQIIVVADRRGAAPSYARYALLGAVRSSVCTIAPLRWLLVKDPTGHIAPAALLCTDQALTAQTIINYFIRRWTVEVTAGRPRFEEVRRHLGVESQRQWPPRRGAIWQS